MNNSAWKTLFGNRTDVAELPGQLWARAIGAALAGAVVALIANWLYSLVAGSTFSMGSAGSSMIGTGIGLAALVYINQRRRRDRAMHLDDETIDNLPKNLG